LEEVHSTAATKESELEGRLEEERRLLQLESAKLLRTEEENRKLVEQVSEKSSQLAMLSTTIEETRRDFEASSRQKAEDEAAARNFYEEKIAAERHQVAMLYNSFFSSLMFWPDMLVFVPGKSL